jgi:dihydrofolate reductase
LAFPEWRRPTLRRLHERHPQVRRLEAPEEPLGWNNSTPIKGNLADEITELKWQPGEDIRISASPTLVRSLLQEDLLVERGLMVHPIVVGSSRRLFEGGVYRKALELVDSKAFGTGVLYLTYLPAGARPRSIEGSDARPTRRLSE